MTVIVARVCSNEQGIVAQYIMPATPQRIDVAERCNRTLIDMVRRMVSNRSFPQFLWGEAL